MMPSAGTCRPPAGHSVASKPGVTRAIFDRDRALERRLDRLALEVEQGLAVAKIAFRSRGRDQRMASQYRAEK